ncbi:MAG: hypothetical protein EXR76_04130 [Myxococcales bacterium]|nr:hypothetical protein [Myxococcales bacterium]
MRTASIIIALLLSAGSAAAQDKAADPVKTKFYDFNDMLIEGQYKKPQVLYTDARQKARFERLLALKKDFLPNLKFTARDGTLR